MHSVPSHCTPCAAPLLTPPLFAACKQAFASISNYCTLRRCTHTRCLQIHTDSYVCNHPTIPKVLYSIPHLHLSRNAHIFPHPTPHCPKRVGSMQPSSHCIAAKPWGRLPGQAACCACPLVLLAVQRSGLHHRLGRWVASSADACGRCTPTRAPEQPQRICCKAAQPPECWRSCTSTQRRAWPVCGPVGGKVRDLSGTIEATGKARPPRQRAAALLGLPAAISMQCASHC